MDYNQIENKYYLAKYGIGGCDNHYKIWEYIKNDIEILKWAITKCRDKFNKRDTVNGLAICESILINYSDIDKDIYNELLNLIYSNKNIARIVLDGASNGGYSYLLMALWNYDFKLTEDMKKFAVDEAMNKIGTIRYRNKMDEYSEKLDNAGITDKDTSMIDIDGCVTPIGKKTKCEYINYMFNSMSDTQAHGEGEFDIRYCILRNSNWNIDEKKKLVYDFWKDDLEYSECLDAWIWNIYNVIDRFSNDSNLDMYDLEEYTYDFLINIIGYKHLVDKIWKEIEFCKLMENLRPKTYEDDDKKLKKEIL